ncbi:flagellar hook-length control protein FliK [Endozoicomonas ascidiicola]|uniref:flagellar hook-length control protein FliK n=1 Tax=Endozoicomonas ascidiicola TaxID=1698521 RepID=UPI00082F50DA|nr:flagellar hook-length control protein FliK [Endozoicomonas ascidiicola]
MPVAMNALSFPVPQQSAGGDIQLSATEGAEDFQAVAEILASLIESDGQVSPELNEQLLEQMAETLPEGVDESVMAEVTAFIDEIIRLQEGGSESLQRGVGQLALDGQVQPTVSADAGAAARIAMDKLPDVSALYASYVVTKDTSEQGKEGVNQTLLTGLIADELPDAEQPENALKESSLMKSAAPERMEILQALRSMERSLFTAPVGNTDNVITASPMSAVQTAVSSQMTTAQPLTSTQTTPNQLPLPMNADDNEWSNALGQRLMTLVGDKVKEAHIRLDPPELGQLGIKVTVEDDHLKIRFASALPQVREMLEGQSERLRAAFDGSSFARVDIDVRQQQAGREGHQPSDAFTADAGSDESTDESLVTTDSTMLSTELPLPKQTSLDVFA